MGLTLELPATPTDEGLWPEHLPAWRAWMAISGQWRTQMLMAVAQGVVTSRMLWIGIDYGAAEAALRLAGIMTTPDLWDEVRCIETGAIEELNRVR